MDRPSPEGQHFLDALHWPWPPLKTQWTSPSVHVFGEDEPDGMVFCPQRRSRIAIMRCGQYQEQFNCQLGCSNAASVEDISVVLRNALILDEDEAGAGTYRCISCGERKPARYDYCKNCQRAMLSVKRRLMELSVKLRHCPSCDLFFLYWDRGNMRHGAARGVARRLRKVAEKNDLQLTEAHECPGCGRHLALLGPIEGIESDEGVITPDSQTVGNIPSDKIHEAEKIIQRLLPALRRVF